ncbi:22040_t:CDS:2 [Dentiscutata erythropus]|uniref:22040_t:CDS:1 n=1 Tax=Dentiscutata erythropus TaxID=1348616 RepID=A0A9N8YYV2_9GLOM|nr:22040_t:CDS:2 [Dentiscutata erythropus]
MPHPTTQNSDDMDNLSAYDEAVENNNAANIVKNLQAAVNQQETSHQEASEVELYDEELEDEELEDEDTMGLLEDKIETCNWRKKISVALQNLVLDIKKENVNSEVWVHLCSIRFYLQLVKNNHQKMEANKIIADVAGKGVYHAKYIRFWAHEYIMTHQIPYSCRGHHAKTWSFLWDEDILLQIKSYIRENKWNITPHMVMLQMNEVILLGLGFAPPPTISYNTAKNYLKELEYIYRKVQKGIYIDRHEREDVVAYWNIFLR